MLVEKIFKNKKVFFISFLVVIIITGSFFGLYLFNWLKKTELQKQGSIGEFILKDFSSQPIVSLSQAKDNYQVKDTLKQGVTIQYANLTEEQKKEQGVMPKDELNIELPKNYQESINIKLDEQRVIFITDKNGANFSDKLIVEKIPLFVNNELRIKNQEEDQEIKNEDLNSKEIGLDKSLNPEVLNGEKLKLQENQTQEVKYLKYQDKEKRKSVYYAYQKETAARKLKHWTIYNHPDKKQKEEKETYQISNAKLKLNDKGEIEVFYFGTQEIQNEEVKAEVEPSLMERAQRTLQKELGEDIMNSNNHTPNFIIPAPYYINKDQKRADLKWELNQEKNEISISFKPSENEYPLALDPTLQFTAPGQDNSGDIITSNNVEEGGYFGSFFASGDFNDDGRTDLAVGADDYLSGTGRVYVFYNDSYIPGAAAMADLIITGESAGGEFGNVIASGDFNNDGKTDLAIGAYDHSTNGRVYIFYNDGSMPTTAATADVIINGESNSYFGFSLASGDFNNDSKTDLAIGAYGYSSSAGRAYIFYNDGSMPTTAATADVIITGEGVYFGYSLMSGDFNNDGTIDLAAGAYRYSSYTGRVYIFYNDGSIPTTATTADVIITGEANSYFGFYITKGDFDSSGTIDLAVGANGYSSDTGRVYIFYNDGSIPATAATADVVITGEGTSNQFGRFLTSGDFDADGDTDLVVGAYYYSGFDGRVYIFYNDGSIPTTAATADVIITSENNNGGAFGRYIEGIDFDADGDTDLIVGAYNYTDSRGRVYVFYNDDSYPSLAINADKIVSGGADIERFGSVMTSGDFNTDGKVDLAVAAKNSSAHAGKIYIFYNDGSYDTSPSGADLTILGEDAYNYFGSSLLSTDFNSDGKTDLIVGASGYSSGAGRLYIFYNDGSIPTDAANADSIITGESNSNFGVSVIDGDFNNDGKTDLAVGASFYTTNTGQAYVFYNDGSIPATAATANVIITGEGTNNYFGSSMSSGDFNADGKTDLVIGAYGYSSNNIGRVYIFYCDGSTPTTATTADIKITGETVSYFGFSMASGDFNADGRVDLAVGAHNYSSTGRAYIFYNDGSISTTAATADATITGEGSVNYFGFSLTSGDFNADGKTDLVAGAYESSGTLPYYYTGRAYVFYNDGSMPATATTADVLIIGENAHQNFGYSMTGGDFNADGKTDLAIGANQYSSGRVYIFYSQNGQISITNIIADENGQNKNIGYSLLSDDFNNDSRTDLVIGSIEGSNYLGRVYIFYNDGLIDSAVAFADVVIIDEGGTMDNFGTSMISGDFNDDGTVDLVVGSYSSSNAYIFYCDGVIPTVANDADIIITGSSQFGRSMTNGDFNNDGKTDLVVSDYNNVYIFYNDGLIPTTAATADLKIVAESSSDFGASMIGRDFNNDGTTDLAVGASSYSSNTGRAYVFYNDGSIPTLAVNADIKITGEAASNYFSSAMTSGDFNSDGVTDLAIGSYNYTSNTGRVYLFYNDGSTPATAASADVIITGETTNNYFGIAMSSGDFNSDGTIDLAVGASRYSNYIGRAYIFYNDGLIPSTAATADVIISGESNSRFGYPMSSGDFNADGRTDLAVGGSGYSSNTGRIHIFYNDGSIPTTAVTADLLINGDESFSLFGTALGKGDLNSDGKTDLIVGAKRLGADKGGVYVFYADNNLPTSTDATDLRIVGENIDDYFGGFITTGDFNNDGTIDLVVSATSHSSNTGRAYIFYNDGNIPTTAATADVIITGETAGDYFGSSMVGGDMNLDGKTDLIVGSDGYLTSTGRAYIFYNDGSIPTTAAAADFIITGEGTGSSFGNYMMVGDFNNDTRNDLVVAAVNYHLYNYGRIYIFYNDGAISNLASSADIKITGTNFLGTSMDGGDFNNDGRIDLLVGSDYENKIYVFYNDGSIPTTTATADIIISHNDSLNYFGNDVVAGDFNADGKIDLATSATGGSGRLYIFYNDGSIPALSLSADVIVDGYYNGFGSSLISGDFNVDGRMDLGVGSNNGGLDLTFYIYTVDAPGTKPNYIKTQGGVQFNGGVVLQ